MLRRAIPIEVHLPNKGVHTELTPSQITPRDSPALQDANTWAGAIQKDWGTSPFCGERLETASDEYVKALLHCDTSAFPDTIGNTVTNHDATLSTDSKKFGTGALSLNGTTAYLEVGTGAYFKFLHAVGTDAEWTVDFWFKAGDFDTAQYFFDTCGAASASVGTVFGLNANRTFTCTIARGVGGAPVMAMTTTGTYPNDTTNFHHIMVTYDQTPANSNCKIYVDGTVLAGVGNKTAEAPSAADATYALAIGAYKVGTPAGFVTGLMDEIRISNTLRTATDFTPETKAYNSSSAEPVSLIYEAPFNGNTVLTAFTRYT